MHTYDPVTSDRRKGYRVGVRVRTAELEKTTLDFVASVSDAKVQGVVMSRFQAFIEQMGFSSVACLRVPQPGEDLSRCLLMNTRPLAFTNQYIERNYVRRDPLVREMFLNYHPYAWSDVFEGRRIDRLNLDIRHEAEAFGLRNGFVAPIYGSSGYAGMVSVAGEYAEVRDDARRALTLASIYLYSKLSALERQQTDPDVLLTARELECLKWAAEGKSDWEIGQILSISSKTVNFHIENVKRKFGVSTRMQAVVASLRQTLLAQQ